MKPYISFIVPVYKAEKTLEKCVKSILSQNIEECEIILVDDGSPDRSGEICDEIAENCANVKVIHKMNGGQGAARNEGAKKASGEWLMFIDDDDWLDEDMYLTCKEYLQDDVDILIFGRKDVFASHIKYYNIHLQDGIYVFDNEKKLKELQLSCLNYYYPCELPLYKIWTVTPWGKFIRRKFWENNDLAFVEAYSEDRPCLLKAYGFAKKVIYVDQPFYNFRFHQSTSRKYLERAADKHRLSLETIHKYVEEYKSDDIDFSRTLYQTDIAYITIYIIQDWCNKNNPYKYTERKKAFFSEINKFPFCNIPFNLDCSMLPPRRRIMAFFIKHRIFCMLNFLCRANDVYNKIVSHF
mgnify:CR=1 FL=1